MRLSRKVSVGLVAVFTSTVFLAPLCGALFSCGCTWLWAGAAEHCNIHNATPPFCPWCIHHNLGFLIAAPIAISFQFLAGLLALQFTGRIWLAFLITGLALLPIGTFLGVVTKWLIPA